MIASIFLLFVAAGIIFGSIIYGFGHLGAVLLALAGIGLLAWIVFALFSRRQTF
ncbi:MAG: hypothetical protein HKN27_10280 [Silicimonas sp.]|nr:hypothetical protein [Silicimonas sp.]